MPPSRTIAAAFLLCATAGVAAPLATLLPNTISIERAPGRDAALPDPTFVTALDDAFATHGFTVLPQPGHARLVADLTVTRTQVGTTGASVPAAGPSVAGGGTRGVGASLTLDLPTGKVRNVPLVQTRLDVRVSRRGGAQPEWTGSAVTVGPAEEDAKQAEQLASKLANAVLRAQDGAGTIAVR